MKTEIKYEGNEDIKVLARQEAGNHLEFSNFAWHYPPWNVEGMGDEHEWAMYYTKNRDSTLLAQSNHAYIQKAMEPYEDDGTAKEESHGCWAYGWREGFAIRVFKQGEVTDAFKVWMNMQDAMNNYPVLDEEDYSERELEATLDNIKNYIAEDVKDDAPEGWECDVYQYLSDHHQDSLESTDDQGGWPHGELVQEALKHHGYLYIEEEVKV